MKIIFKQVLIEEGLPIKSGRYHTNIGLKNYFHEPYGDIPKGFESIAVNYWLEPIALPTDEDIKTEWDRLEQLDRESMSGESPTFRQGARYVLNFINNYNHEKH